jgi:hypothetical protein
MRTTVFCYAAVLVAGSISASIAQAQYRCSPISSPVDRAACLAAEQGPDALRRHIERMRAINTPLYFYDYVNEARAQAWDAKERQLRAAREAEMTAAREVTRAAPK